MLFTIIILLFYLLFCNSVKLLSILLFNNSICFYNIFFIILLQPYYFIDEVPTSQVAGIVAQPINHCIIGTYDLTNQRRQ